MMHSWKTPSSSGTKEYTSILADDGKLTCNCMGWTSKREGKPRYCTHHKDYVKANGLAIETRGEFVYVVRSAHEAQVLADAVAEPARPTQEVAGLAQKAVPMLASAMTDPVTGAAFDERYASGWVMEEKINGHRCVCVIQDGVVTAFSRPEEGKRNGNLRDLPPHIVAVLKTFPDCITDGELVAPSGQSWDVPTGGSEMLYVIFDLLRYRTMDLTQETYRVRRAATLDVLGKMPKDQRAITTVESVKPTWAGVQAILDRDGEGVIVKRENSTYRPGHRTPDWVKVKRRLHATLVIYGFAKGKDHAYAKMQLRDDQGRTTTCKTPTSKMLREAAANPAAFIGRRVVVHFPGWTSNGYGGPVIFDHFAGEGE